MTLQLLHSEFPYTYMRKIWFSFFSVYQSNLYTTCTFMLCRVLLLLLCDLSLALGTSWSCPLISISTTSSTTPSTTSSTTPSTLSTTPPFIANTTSSDIVSPVINPLVLPAFNTSVVFSNSSSTPPPYFNPSSRATVPSLNASSWKTTNSPFSSTASVSISCSCSLAHTLRCDGFLQAAKKDVRTALELILMRLRYSHSQKERA